MSTEQPTVFIMEDLHWADPTTLELLDMIVDQGPTNRIATVLTFRPEFVSPWIGRAHLTQITVNRLTRGQVKEIVGELAGGKSLPAEVLERVVAHSDGVPLFAEELTKTVLESGVLTEADDRYNLTGELTHLAIPSTLQGSLTARLDRLSTVKQVAQLGSVIGREFTYELVQAVSTQDEAVLQRDLGQLVEADLLYQRGMPPHASYTFKHALVQDAAYESLLKSTSHEYHWQVAEVLENRFRETAETQPKA